MRLFRRVDFQWPQKRHILACPHFLRRGTHRVLGKPTAGGSSSDRPGFPNTKPETPRGPPKNIERVGAFSVPLIEAPHCRFEIGRRDLSSPGAPAAGPTFSTAATGCWLPTDHAVPFILLQLRHRCSKPATWFGSFLERPNRGERRTDGDIVHGDDE